MADSDVQAAAKELVNKLKSFDLTSDDAADVVEKIESAVGRDAITWRELGITRDECYELARLTKVWHLQTFIRKMQDGLYDLDAVKVIIRHIKRKVADGTTSWDELGTTKEEVDRLKSKARK